MNHHIFTKLTALTIVTAGMLSATVLPYNYTTTGNITGSPSNIAFNPQSTAVSGATNALGTALGLALGSFTLSKPGAHNTVIYNNAFSLDIAFSVPTITGASTFSALLSGTLVNGTGKSSVDLIFTPSSKTFNFTSPSNGTFDFTVHDIVGMDHSAGGPATYNLTGDITNAQDDSLSSVSAVPEPSSVVLLLTVAGGLGLAMRRRMLH